MSESNCCESSSCGGKRCTWLLPAVLGALAIGTAVPAWLAGGSDAASTATVSEMLGKAGVGAEQIAGLRVVTWDEASASPRPFEVKKVGGQWVIPSNYDYPADGNTRVSKTAAGFLGVARGRPITADVKDHESLDLLDPLGKDVAGKKSGFGKRVTLTDSGGAVALDLIVGKRSESGSGMYFVREAGSNEVYTAKVDPYELSTRFIDFVEVDPFKIKRDDLRDLALVEYSIDADRGTVAPGPATRLARAKAEGDWTSAQVPQGKRPAKAEVDKILSELTGIRLAGVRPFRLEWLGARGIYALDAAQAERQKLPSPLVVGVQTKQGSQRVALFGTEGRLDATTKDGLKYSFMFGKVALGDEADASAEAKGEADAKAAASASSASAAKPAETGSNRYLAVFVQYVPEADEDAKAEAAASASAATAAKADDKAKKKGGRERAAKAQERFQRFFYVISDSTFKALRPEVQKLWEDLPKEPMAGATGKTNKQWLADNAGLPGITTTASGLQWQSLKAGAEGGKRPLATDQVQVKYKGTLIDGTVFDESSGDGATFRVDGLIKGWTEALQLMKEGDQWKLWIPPEIGYGEAGSPPKIGANAILVFEVELVKVIGQGQPAATAPAPAATAAVEPAAPAPAATPAAAEPKKDMPSPDLKGK